MISCQVTPDMLQVAKSHFLSLMLLLIPNLKMTKRKPRRTRLESTSRPCVVEQDDYAIRRMETIDSGGSPAFFLTAVPRLKCFPKT